MLGPLMHRWKERVRPIRLERRFEFDSYDETRNFLDELGKLCELIKRFPDVSFGKTYVNLTLFPESEEKDAPLTDEDNEMAKKIDGIIDQ